jgi:acyl transferase domain-containing protein
LDKDSSRVSEAHISQPACTAIQLALTTLFFSWGIRPNAVAGHSSGEIGAAYAAGILNLEDSVAIAYYRGQAIMSLKKNFPAVKGAMMAVGGSAEQISPLVKVLRSGKATIACINSPSSITASGDENAISELQELIEGKRMFNRKLRVDVAYHSHHMSLVGAEYLAMIKDVNSQPTSDVSFYSSLRGHLVDGSDLGPEYWRDNLTSPVRFSEAVREMCLPLEKNGSKPNMDILIEIGPHSALEGPVKQILKAIGANALKIPYASSLIRNIDAVHSTLDLAATLFMKGVNLDMKSINFPTTEDKAPILLSDMPRYPWYHGKGYWHHSRINEKHLQRDGPRNDILGTLANYSNELEPTWRNIISIDDMPWLRQHKMSSLTVYPIAGYMAMAIEAASRRATARKIKFDSFELREVTANRALVIDEGASVETNITLRSHAEGTRTSSDTWDEFRIFSWSRNQGWLEHCRGLVAVRKAVENDIDGKRQTQDVASLLRAQVASINDACTTAVNSHEMYDTLSTAGAEYGTLFRGLKNVRASDSHAVADLTVPDMASTMPSGHQPDLIIHPAFLDHFIQAVFPVLGAGRIPFEALYMPSFIKRVSISYNVPRGIGQPLTVYASGNPTPSDPAPTDLSLFAINPSDGNEALIRMESLTMTPVSTGSAVADTAIRDLCYKLQWEPVIEEDKENGEPSTELMGTCDGLSTPPFGPDLDVVIICDQLTQASLTNELATALTEATGRGPEIGSLEDINPAGKVCIFLTELVQPFLADLSSRQFSTLQKVLTSADGILWVVKGAYAGSTCPNSNMVVGLGRTLRSETLLNFTILDLDQTSSRSDNLAARFIVDVFNRSFVPSSLSVTPDREYMERHGEILVPRFIDDNDMNKFVHQETKEVAPDLQPFAQAYRPLKMKIKTPGALDTLYFEDDAAVGTPLSDLEVEINVKATSMNFKDVMIAMGQLSSKYLGIECSGVVTAAGSKVAGLVVGDRVCAMSEGAYSTYTRCLGTSVQKIPDDLSFEIAATIPVIYCTAYYSLFDLAHLLKGERILIHAAAGGVGQAAIQLSQMIVSSSA